MGNNDWINDAFVQNWFQLLGSDRIIKNYTKDFSKFLSHIQETTECKTPTDIISSRIEHLASNDLLKRKFWEQQVIKYKNSLETQNQKTATVKRHIQTVMSFFSKNGVKLLFSGGELKFNPNQPKQPP